MPRVPTYDNFQTSITGPSNAQFQSPTGPTPGGIAADQLNQFGQAATKTGEAIGRLALDAADQANQVRINGAVNQVRAASQDLAFNPQTGYRVLKGDNALIRPDGRSLDQEYDQKLQARISEIDQSLSNDQQRRAFRAQAGDLTTQFRGQVESHWLGEYMSHADTVSDDTTALALNGIKLHYDDPEYIFGRPNPTTGKYEDGAIDTLKGSIMEKMARNGLKGAPAEKALLAGVSQAHTGVVMAALQNNNPTYALSYMGKVRKAGELSGDDILKLQGHVNQAMDLRLSQSAIKDQTTASVSTLAPTGFDRMAQITAVTESGGRETNPDGSIVTSPKGALGSMQVMPATAANPGMGLKPLPADATPGQRAQFGRDYLQVLLTKYGDPDKAWAAYNAGPGALDKALKSSAQGRGQGDWLSYLPQETQAYVAKNMKALSGSGSVAPRPTELEFVNGALVRLPEGASPQAIKFTREAAAQQFTMINKSLTEKGDNALADAQRWVIDNQATTLTQLPPQLKDALTRYAPGKMDDLDKFAKVQGNVPTDWGAYSNLRALAATDPMRFASTDLRQQYHLLAPAQREQLLDLQMKAKDPSTRPEVTSLTQQLTMAHERLQFRPNDGEKKGKFDDAVTQALAADTRDKGRALTFEERDKVIKRMMLVTSESSWFSSAKRVYEVSGTPDEATQLPKIGDDDRKLITAALTSEGLQPTENNIVARFKQRYGIR